VSRNVVGTPRSVKNRFDSPLAPTASTPLVC
jgi:hypothetical protein